jgi:hypothetical protein
MKAKICMTMALAAVCTMGAAQTQRAIDDIDKEIARLERSDELQTRRTDNANAFFNAKLYNQQKAGNRKAPHIQDCKTLYFKYLAAAFGSALSFFNGTLNVVFRYIVGLSFAECQF